MTLTEMPGAVEPGSQTAPLISTYPSADAETPLSAERSSRPLRVCHLAYTFYETDNRVRRYAEALAERGDTVEVFALRRGGEPARSEHHGVSVHRLQRRQVTEGAATTYLAKILLFLVRATAVISARHAVRPYDVLHVHNLPDFLVFAAWLPKLTGARIILDIHDILPELYSDKFRKPAGSWTFKALRWVERRSSRFADHVIVAGDLWRDKLIQRAQLKPERCTTMLNYPDRRVFRPASDRSEEAGAKFIVLYPGTLNHHQGVDIAVRAFGLVKDRMPNAEFHIYGEGPALGSIKALIEASGLHGCVKVKPPVSIDDIARVIANADLGVIPKRAEGFGNEAFSTKSLEFMACGVPVVMSRTEVDAHHFDESLVRFFESGNPESLAAALLADYSCRDLRVARAKRASTFVASMDWAVKLPSYLNIVEGGSVRG
jgi:glycosyltransferase involved in cell wall biosynthesis